MKLKKLIVSAIAVLTLVVSAVFVVGCSGVSFDGIVKYDGNGGTLVSGRETQYLMSGTVEAPVYTREGYSLLGFEKENGDSYTLKAIWGKTSQGLTYALSEDETYYSWTGLGTCTDATIIPAHWYDGKPVREASFYALGNGANSTASTVIFPYGFTSSGIAPFTRAEALKTVVFSETITTLGMAMAGASGIETVYIPTSLTWAMPDAFNECPLRNVYYAGSEAEWAKIDIDGSTNETAISGATITYNMSFDYSSVVA